GAMRFVKGDAIAAIVIVVVNLVGGLVIGVGSRGMTVGDAMRTYSLLSIGAGLVAQIPSLLVAVASGLLVTRVASAGDRELGEDLGAQLAGSPRALGGAAVLLVGLAIVPGLPAAPVLVLGAIDETPVAWISIGPGRDDALRVLDDKLAGALASLVPELLGVDRVAALVDRAAAQAPLLVREVVPRAVALPVLAELLRQLAREH